MSVLRSKSPSPRLLSLFTALIISSSNALLSLTLRPQWYMPLVVFAITFIITYSLYYYTLQRFIYRKIKLIYKFIYHTKATKKEEFFYENLLPRKSIEEVSDDVQKWALQKRNEIATLQANEQFRKEFLMNLAHELRTPIFTVQGYIDTLLGGAIDDPDVNKKFLNNASKGTERLVRLVDDLGEISKLESGRIPLVQESFVIQDLIKDVYEELTLRAKEKNIHLQFKKGTERPLAVYADKQKIKQVLVNLVENSIKYGHDNGTVIAGSYIVDDKHVYTEISDDGPGIGEEHISRIFERFYRADRSRSRTIGGTGLGLAIVKHIIEAHGHQVTVRSTLNVGSSFGFTLDRGKE
ncbi:sensor histidine kinase [Polluticoccus soli]|uniref:sensor histidine kinase n=1 Tax=Polluticoccus soli TaxID=3034150 RepID=UPI0023E32F47|nr:ATP-binding protein [Flavipsychrobacter sp. JY13-12]